ncbi:MAG: J domain-containing protein [Sphingomonas sp.]
MAEDASAYAALGVEQGADSATIEQAYKKLIKEHHPDREGGDARRAAEINRAYRELRAERNLKDPLELNPDWVGPRQGGRAWTAVVLVIAAGLLVLLLVQGPLATKASRLASLHHRTGADPRASGADPMDEPLHVSAIDTAAQHALLIARTRDEMALASTSRDCHHLLRSDPSLVQLDRCAAFDDAVVLLQDRDPLRDQGPFGELAVTGRLWSGATAMSDDYVAIDNRLDRIRLRVEIALAPLIQPTAPAVPANSS